MTNNLSLFELFTGDGILQGVFIKNGEIEFINHIIETDKIKHEHIFGKISNNVFILPLLLMLYKIHILPNILGLANTAILKVKNKTYSLFERDLPYLIDINIENKTIHTIGKQPIDNVDCISGHSKYETVQDRINTIEYDYIRRTVSLYKLSADFKIQSKKTIRTNYMPITHDYMVYGNNNECMLFCDSPFVIDFGVYRNGLNQVPVVLDNTKPTYIHTYNFTDGVHKTYKISENGFYIFHFSQIHIDNNNNHIQIYTTLYDKLDFNHIDIHGKYRRIELDILNTTGKIHNIPDLCDTLNLDFPVAFNDTTILRNIQISETSPFINGFIMMKNDRLKQTLLYEDLCFCGEPAIGYDAEGIPFLLSFAYNNVDGFFVMINMNTNEMIKKKLRTKPQIGFHSIFL
jgi:carotenoid cleavage dioxygenase-like enzyme